MGTPPPHTFPNAFRLGAGHQDRGPAGGWARKRREPEVTVLGGLLRGLSSYLEHFGGSVEDGAAWLAPLYQFLVAALAADTGVTRCQPPLPPLPLTPPPPLLRRM